MLSARLNDARFFWDEDRKTRLEDRLEKLKGVTFHAKLGPCTSGSSGIEIWPRELAPAGRRRRRPRPSQAARLAKADLVTGMVGEFPELQGVMGGYYAARRGPRPARSPTPSATTTSRRAPATPCPTAPVTMAVALADKLDTLTGFFAIDEKPTGSRDPFALRRAALGVIRIVLGSELRMPLREVVADWYRSLRCFVDPGRALWVSTPRLTAHLGAAAGQEPEFDTYLREFDEALLDGKPQVVAMDREVDLVFDRLEREKPAGEVLFEFRPYDEVVDEVLAFFADRLKVLLRDQGQRHDLVDAVFALGDDDLVRIVARVEALDAFLKTEDGANLLAGYKRAVNILKAEEKKGAAADRRAGRAWPASPAEEAALIAALGDARAELDAALDAEDFAGAMRALAALRGAGRRLLRQGAGELRRCRGTRQPPAPSGAGPRRHGAGGGLLAGYGLERAGSEWIGRYDGEDALGLCLRRRRRRRRRLDEEPAGRQGRQPGRDVRRWACRCRRASPSPPRPASTTTPTSSTYPADLKDQVAAGLATVEEITGKTFGDAANPLLVSVRSGARASMPGMMDTVLNLGLNDETVEGLAKLSGDRRFAFDSYRRFIQMYSNVVLDLDHHMFEEILDEHKDRLDVHVDTGLTAEDWEAVVADYKAAVRARAGQALPAGPARPALGRGRRGVRQLDERPGQVLPPHARHPRELGHGGQRPVDGVRQHGRRPRPPASPSPATRPPARTASTASS